MNEKNIKISETRLSNTEMRSQRRNGKLEIITNDGFEIDLQV